MAPTSSDGLLRLGDQSICFRAFLVVRCVGGCMTTSEVTSSAGPASLAAVISSTDSPPRSGPTVFLELAPTNAANERFEFLGRAALAFRNGFWTCV